MYAYLNHYPLLMVGTAAFCHLHPLLQNWYNVDPVLLVNTYTLIAIHHWWLGGLLLQSIIIITISSKIGTILILSSYSSICIPWLPSTIDGRVCCFLSSSSFATKLVQYWSYCFTRQDEYLNHYPPLMVTETAALYHLHPLQQNWYNVDPTVVKMYTWITIHHWRWRRLLLSIIFTLCYKIGTMLILLFYLSIRILWLQSIIDGWKNFWCSL